MLSEAFVLIGLTVSIMAGASSISLKTEEGEEEDCE